MSFLKPLSDLFWGNNQPSDSHSAEKSSDSLTPRPGADVETAKQREDKVAEQFKSIQDEWDKRNAESFKTLEANSQKHNARMGNVITETRKLQEEMLSTPAEEFANPETIKSFEEKQSELFKKFSLTDNRASSLNIDMEKAREAREARAKEFKEQREAQAKEFKAQREARIKEFQEQKKAWIEQYRK